MRRRRSCRYCRSCGARLAQDHTETRCGPCQRKTSEAALRPPPVPPEFWETAQMREALASRHLGSIIRAYRHHRFHGPQPLPQQVVAGWMGLTQTQLSRIETGPPVSDLHKLTRWAQTLGIPQGHLWFDLPGQSRNGLARVSPQTASSCPVDDAHLEESRSPSSEVDDVLEIAPTRRVSPATIEALRASITDFWKRDDQFGGEALRPAVIAQLRHTLRLLSECRREDQRHSLFGIAAEFARLAGWMFFDARQYRTARTYFEQALRLIREIDDRAFIANVLAGLSLQATYEDNPVDALVLVRAAQDTCHGVATPRFIAVLSMREAFAHAVLAHEADCRSAVSHSHTSFEKTAATDADPAWVAYFDETKLIADTGIALSRLGDHQAAEPLISDAIKRQDPANTRTLAFHTFWLASTHLRADDLDEACAKATDVLRLAKLVNSARITGRIHEFQRMLKPFERQQPAKDFNARAAQFFHDHDHGPAFL